jgi:metal-sulfur cluster biosynthetic enzyme
MTRDDPIAAALDGIYDPCSVAAGRPLSLRAMGLVRDWTFERGTLSVTFAVTFPGCTMAPHFVEAARAALAEIPGVARVVTRVDTDFVWTPDEMRGAAPAMRGTPQAWRARALNPG